MSDFHHAPLLPSSETASAAGLGVPWHPPHSRCPAQLSPAGWEVEGVPPFHWCTLHLELCPLLQAKCVQGRCAWWVRDWHEEKNRYNIECAVSLIALGVNDESLFRLKGKRPAESA